MFALSFDMEVAKLREYYGEPYNNAYVEIKRMLLLNGFFWVQGSTYITKEDDLGVLIAAVIRLRSLSWFQKSVRDIRGFRVEAWSDLNNIVKNVSL